MNKTLKQFIYWLEEEDRENWDIERYVEAILNEPQNHARITQPIHKLSKSIQIYKQLTFLRDKDIPKFLVVFIDWLRYKFYEKNKKRVIKSIIKYARTKEDL